jgi:hypothetical protein
MPWSWKKGTSNLMKTDEILAAAALLGDKDQMVGYLGEIAANHPHAFGKVLARLLPSEWLPPVFGGDAAEVADDVEAKAIPGRIEEGIGDSGAGCAHDFFSGSPAPLVGFVEQLDIDRANPEAVTPKNRV